MTTRCLALVLLAGAAAAQVNPGTRGTPPQLPQQPAGQQPQQPGAPAAGLPVPPPPEQPQPGTTLVRPQDPWNPIWVVPRPLPRFSGFPVVPSRLGGYGQYPQAAGRAGALGDVPVPLPPATGEDPGWPGWVRTAAKQPLPFSPGLALLVRHADRVWSRSSADEPFVPRYFHDKLATLAAGAEVEVRHVGEFELLLHDSSRLLARGPTRLRLVALSPEAVQLELPELTWMRLGASARAHTITLPDGSRLEFGAPADATAGPADVIVARTDEPGWLGGRATLTNVGTREVTWHHAFGAATLPPGHRVTFFLQPPAAPHPAALQTTTAVEPAGDGVRCRAATDGVVRWSGARFVLPAGALLQFDPLLGAPFADAGRQ